MRKSNYLAAAMAFAAIVGCQKELAPVAGIEQAGDAGLDQRPVLASSELTFGGAETRVEAGNDSGIGWVWEAGDQVGAMIVDRIKKDVTLYAKVNGTTQSATWSYADYVKGSKLYGTTEVKFADTYTNSNCTASTTSEAFYKVVDAQVWTNYPYTTENAKWFSTPATLVEGHYMFYAPYNENNGTRGPLVATLPVNQKVGKEGTEAVDAFYKGETPAILTVNYLSAEETSTVNPSSGHIYAYPQFKISNNFKGFLFDGTKTASDLNYISTDVAQTYTMTLKQIEFYAGTEESLLAYKRSIKPTAVYSAVKDSEWVLNATKTSSYENLVKTSYITTVYEANAFTSDELNKMVANPAIDFKAKNPAQRIIVDLGGYELPYGKTYSFNVVMPAEDYTEGGLFARIVVEIDGQDYYIVTNEVAKTDEAYAYDANLTVAKMPEKPTKDEVDHAIIPVSGIEGGDYQFADRHDRSSDKIELARGNRYAKIEINKNNTTKTHAGELLTIELVGGLAQVGVAVAEGPAPKEGIETNEDLYDFLDGVDNNADVEEVSDPTESDDYKHFYLVEGNTVVINAELIKELDNKLNKGTFTLKKNLPIADDVTVAHRKGNTYRFTTADGTWYDISYKDGSFGPKAGKLTEGINVIATDTKLAASGVENAVVIVETGNTATVETPAGIMGIILEGSAKLVVNSKTDVTAWINATDESSVEVKAGALTNNANDFAEAAISNQALAEIAGNAEGVVSYTSNGFVAKEIAANTQINKVTIDAVRVQERALTVTQALIARYGKLTDVTYVFTDKFVEGFYSEADIAFTNGVEVRYEGTPAVKWTAPVTTKGTKIAAGNSKKANTPFFVNIVPAKGAILVDAKGNEFTSDMVYDMTGVQEAAKSGNVTFGNDLSTEAVNNAAINMENGGTVDGNSFSLDVTGTGSIGVQTTGGEIKDLEVSAGFKGIYAELNDDLTLNNVTSTGTYALNVKGNDVELTATNCEFYGWSSWKVGDDNAHFIHCKFGSNGTQCDIAPYGTTLFENCTFEQGLAWNFDKEGNTVRMNGSSVTTKQVIKLKNCYVGDTKITKDNFNEIFNKNYYESKTENGKWSNSFFTVWLDPTEHYPGENNKYKTISYFFEVVE